MFGSGNTSGFGGFGSGTTSTPFSGSAFNKPTAPAFGQPAFGATPAVSTPSMFGSGSTGFGSTAPAFGAPTPSTGFGGFGAATSASPGVFGAPRTQPAPLFGSGTTTFGQPATQPAKTGFSFGSGTSVFGQSSTPTATATVFGQPATPAFGATAAGKTMTGTTVKFNPPTGTDTMVKNNSQVHINTRFMCIVTMKEYETKSLEELRMEDYAANRKGPSAGATGFGQPATGGLFGGAASSAGGGLFGATQSKPLFGASPMPATGGLFGSTPQTSTSGLFGAKPAGFGATTSTSTGFSFGQPAAATGGLFGSTQPAGKPLFGGTATGGLFGAPASQPTPAFGSTLTSQPSAGLFGSTPASSTGFSFGTPATTSAGAGLFGAKPTGFSAFGQPAAQPTAPGFSFGATAAKPAGTAFNFGATTGGAFGAGAGSLFGNQNKPVAPTFGGFGSAFGASTPAAPLGGFGAPAQQPSLLGQPAALQLPAVDAQLVQQQILSLTTNPFGDLSLFKNFQTQASMTREEVLRPTNPQAQRAVTEATPYKVSPRLVSKLAPRPVNGSSGTSSLFDGLDEDGGDLDDGDILVPRRSVKKLDLRAAAATSTLPTAATTAVADATRATPGTAAAEVREGTEPATLATPIQHSTKSKLRVTFGPDASMLDSPDIIRGGQLSAPPPEQSTQDADDSICTLQTRRRAGAGPGAASAGNRHGSSGGAVDPVQESFILEDTVSDDGDEAAAGGETTHPAGVKLGRPGYYTLPPLDTLTPADDGSLPVTELTIGRHGYGSVFFPGVTQLAELDLDAIVVFRRREICIYPDDSLKPPLGDGLNKPAQVTLERVWPTDKASREPITDPARLNRIGWEQRLERACLKLGASFVEYRPETGSWVFKVEHFSKYGLNDSDDEETMSSAVSARTRPCPARLAPAAAGSQPAPPPPTASPTDAPPPPPPEAAAQNADDATETAASAEFPADIASPAVRLARSSAIDSEKVQDMKVFFLDEDEGIEDDGGSQLGEDIAPVGHISAFRSGLLSGLPRGPLAPPVPPQQTPLMTPSGGATPDDSDGEDWSESPPSRGVGVVDATFAESALDRSIMDGCRLLESEPHRDVTAIVPRHVNQLLPLHKSSRASAGHLLADLGSAAGPRWRIGWGPCWQLTGPVGAGSSSPFSITNGTLEATKTDDEEQLKAEYCALLAVQLRFSDCEQPEPGGWPLFTTQQDPALAETLAATHTQWADVWRLVAALWGRDELTPPAQDAVECRSHAERQRRREALSRWLESACQPAAAREAETHTDQQYLQTVFSHLTVRQIQEAARVAQRHGDLCLSLLLTQLTGSHEVRQLVRAQLDNWQQVGADVHIEPDRLRIYMLVAGVPFWQAGHSAISLCEGLDWRRALAVHLWYLSPATSSVPEVLTEYNAAWSPEPECAPLAPPPLPEYITSAGGEEQGGAPTDLCHHLISLYARGSGRLESLLTPATHTAQPLDHMLSWLLMQCLWALGYRQLGDEAAAQLHRSLAAQLESRGLWHLAVFVLLHITDTDSRAVACSDLLLRHAPLDLPDDVRHLLLDSFGVPATALSYARALRARAAGRRRHEVKLLLQAERWQEGHDLLVEHIAPECIINEEYWLLGELLALVSPPQVSRQVSGWAGAGQLYLDYIAVSRAVHDVLAGRAAADQLQLLRPQLAALSRRLPQLPCPTAKHRLAQAEMAKKAATLLRALLGGGTSGAGASLLQHLSRLPLPEDYALSEMQDVLRTYLLELNV